MGWADAGDLLDGPRGRRLCWERLDHSGYPGWTGIWVGAQAGDLSSLVGELAECVARMDLDATVTRTSELALLAALAESVGQATYWQEPDGVDRALANPRLRDVLRPLAQAVTAAPAAQWWPGPIALDRQQYAEWIDEHDFSPQLAGAAAELAAWHAATAQDERSARDRPDDPAAGWTGRWWSAPLLSRLPSSTRSVPGLGAVRLTVVEDSLGWREARCWPGGAALRRARLRDRRPAAVDRPGAALPAGGQQIAAPRLVASERLGRALADSRLRRGRQ